MKKNPSQLITAFPALVKTLHTKCKDGMPSLGLEPTTAAWTDLETCAEACVTLEPQRTPKERAKELQRSTKFNKVMEKYEGYLWVKDGSLYAAIANPLFNRIVYPGITSDIKRSPARVAAALPLLRQNLITLREKIGTSVIENISLPITVSLDDVLKKIEAFEREVRKIQ